MMYYQVCRQKTGTEVANVTVCGEFLCHFMVHAVDINIVCISFMIIAAVLSDPLRIMVIFFLKLKFVYWFLKKLFS